MRVEGIYVMYPSNPVHQFLMHELMQEDFQVIRCEGTVKELNKYRFPPIVTKPTLLIIEKLHITQEVVNLLADMSLKKRTIIFQIKGKAERKFLTNVRMKGREVEILPTYKSWKEKETMCMELVAKMDILFSSTKVYKQCIKLMIRSFDLLTQVISELSIHVQTNTVITEAILQEVFHDTEFIPLHVWCVNMLMHPSDRKLIKELHYFLTLKQYAPHWLFEEIKETTMHIGMIYEARFQGIIYNENVSDNIKPRAKVVQSPFEMVLGSLSYTQLKNYLRFAAEIDYKQFLMIQKVVVQADVATATDLYLLLYRIRTQRGSVLNG